MMQYQAEPFSKWCREAIERGLFEAHWREVGVNQDIKKLDPDLNKCFGLERAQALPAYTARSDGALMGYAVFFCSTGLHYREWVTAYADVLYMVPEARGNASQLIRYCERELLARGVHEIVYHFKTARDKEVLMRRLGYDDFEHLYHKVLTATEPD